MDSKMCRECCRSASSRALFLGLERGRGAAGFPSLTVRGGGGGCRLVGDDTAGDRTSVAPVATCRRRSCRSKLCAPPPLLLLLAAAVVVTEAATVGQRNLYARHEGGNSVPQPLPLSLEPRLAPSAADSRSRSPFGAHYAPATDSSKQRTSGADTVDLWPSYESPVERPVGSVNRNRRQLVERCATKMSGVGYFMTPQYPQLVTDGAYTCFWQLSVVYSGQTVSLDLSDLQTSRDSRGGQPDDCGDSYVAVADLSGRVVRYCTPQPQPVLVGENVYVWASGHTQESFGLRASFRSTFGAPDWNPKPPVCGGRLKAGDVFTTPHYPSAYPMTQTCFWAAAAATGRRLTLVFDSFDVGRDATCESDYVTVWTSERGLMPRLCGNVIPDNVSTGTYIFVFFSSDGADDGGAIGFRARFITDGERSPYTTAEVATTKTTVGVSQVTVGGATSAQLWSSADPPRATSALPSNTSASASLAPPSSPQATEPTGVVSNGGSSSPSESSTTAAASISPNAGGSASQSSWATTPSAGSQNNRITSPTAATPTSVSANVSGSGESTKPPLPSTSSSSYMSRITTTALNRSSVATLRPASVSGTGSRSTTRSGQTRDDSAPSTTSPAAVQPESEFSSSTPLPATTLQPGGGSSARPSDDPLSSKTPFSIVSATPEQQSLSTAQPQRTVQPTSEASAASSGTSSTLPPTTTTRRRCKLRQKPADDAASQSMKLVPR